MSPIKVILKPIQRLATMKPNASLLLFLATILAMVLANSPWAGIYNTILSHPIDFQIGSHSFFSHHGVPMTLLEFVNDALMALFFFVIGLEIKQEILIGELSSIRKAMLPIIAAIGGMIVPVLVYVSVCGNAPEVRGAAIPMATDIAFALAVLGALGKRIPLSLRIFLTALAVVDDIGGIIVIGIFYSSGISFEPLLLSIIFLVLSYIGGKMRIISEGFYYILGFVVWMLFVESGIHPTISGVLVAFTIPARPVIKLDEFSEEMVEYLQMLDYTEVRQSNKASVLTSSQIHILNNVHTLADKTISMLQKIIHKLHPLVYYVILPLFAFVNAGVTFSDISLTSLAGIPLAIFLGLFVGKSVGIFTFSWLAIRLRLVVVPPGINKKNLFGVAMLGGIGFTVSLFIANLSFTNLPEIGADLLNQAKLGVFVGSFVSGIIGYLILNIVQPKPPKGQSIPDID
ncbi:NhaA family Na+:H+ antiporter [Parabacteroides sp. PF5-5]|uniref:Na+/H+ antiporter NhaA n=1 Tax=unclassified Parabacteroides TaxID=2649774 RepID=UPI002474EF46|nr:MULTISPECIES: Na+/H+ antiporter NhaA [unclassified Parabacteroides]MDH6304424.1 NhaA family Na+:H+ antiporter [Parabacteroides sp. PH5-39]MDH6315423.1 NhaA family Na+:H+ antiporter [Parabacteroides sp. PF5-13]MDH6322813.1 NhaA family Na+:H+ antiporter [Parabacteroides sp. PH5-8]MDH6326615.1 NhaA family Na+:H+ antiporter [Parabacteroides sp. PH5-41]MDH6334415.1 NhaA family Na+:H+ antiporter [Parabacteroides sp. PF5-5]